MIPFSRTGFAAGKETQGFLFYRRSENNSKASFVLFSARQWSDNKLQTQACDTVCRSTSHSVDNASVNLSGEKCQRLFFGRKIKQINKATLMGNPEELKFWHIKGPTLLLPLPCSAFDSALNGHFIICTILLREADL